MRQFTSNLKSRRYLFETAFEWTNVAHFSLYVTLSRRKMAASLPR